MFAREEAHEFANEWIEAWNAHDLERILSHYAEEVVLTSPVVIEGLGIASGSVSGKLALRAYFERGLATFPSLHFELRGVMWGVSSVVLIYKNQRGTFTGEFMEFDGSEHVIRVVANYSG